MATIRRPISTLFIREKAKIDVRTLEVLEGGVSRRALALIREWAGLHREELERAWKLAESNREPFKIAPLE